MIACIASEAVPSDDVTRNRPVDEEARNQLLDGMEGKLAPSIASDDWLNADALDWDALKGRVVLLDFWGVWCGPCVRAIPKLREWYAQYADEGFVVIGVHTDESMAQGKRYVSQEGIEYPIVFDHGDGIAKRYHVNRHPTYCLVDGHGRLRMADFTDDEIEDAVKFLLNEEYEE